MITMNQENEKSRVYPDTALSLFPGPSQLALLTGAAAPSAKTSSAS